MLIYRSTLGIIAGAGCLPRQVIASCQIENRPLFVLALQGYADKKILRSVPHAYVSLGTVNCSLKLLRKAGVHYLAIVGSVRRPSLWELHLDKYTMTFFSKIGLNKALGDDALLRAVIQVLEDEGFQVLGIDDVARNLVASLGMYGGPLPDDQALSDIRRGIEVAHMLGKVDVGQSVVIQQGLVLAVETIEGTEMMLARCRSIARPGPRGVLVKTCKPNQERRIDLPTVGTQTLNQVFASGLRGIAIEAGSVLVLGKQAIAEQANQLGIFVVGFNSCSI